MCIQSVNLSKLSLKRSSKFKSSCVVIDNNVKEFIGNGKSVFAKHVKKCGNNIKPGSDAVIIDEEGKIIAVGKSLLSPIMMSKFKSGVAIKVRESVNKWWLFNLYLLSF